VYDRGEGRSAHERLREEGGTHTQCRGSLTTRTPHTTRQTIM
jgi:hypothetical protein